MPWKDFRLKTFVGDVCALSDIYNSASSYPTYFFGFSYMVIAICIINIGNISICLLCIIRANVSFKKVTAIFPLFYGDILYVSPNSTKSCHSVSEGRFLVVVVILSEKVRTLFIVTVAAAVSFSRNRGRSKISSRRIN